MPEQPRPSRRVFLSDSAVLLAGFGLAPAAIAASAARTAAALRSAGTESPATAPADLAQYRPVSTSSTGYGPWPGEFAVDGLAVSGVRGSGWQAGGGDPQWITVDLQAACQVESVVLVFEATSSDPAWVPAPGSNPYVNTTGQEIRSSCATAFQLAVSTDNATWTTVYQTTSGTGGVVKIPLAEPVTARWVRMTATQQSDDRPLQLNGFQVYGTTNSPRPPATGWSDWASQSPPPSPDLRVASDGTVPVESGWAMTLDDWADPDNGAVLSGPAASAAGWVPATVPGTVLASLVEQGHFPDPVAGFGNLFIPEALSRHSWWYRRPFRLPEGFGRGSGQRIWLEFDGINHEAQIWLNGRKVGQLSHPFGRGAFDVTSMLDGADQVLAVRISPMPHPGSPGDKGPDGISFLYSDEVSRDFPSYISASGWDWMPAVRDRVCGIWNHVRLRSTGPVVLGDPRVDTSLPALPDTSRAEVTVVVPVRNATSATQPVTVTAAFGDVKVSATVSVPGHGQAEATFSPERFPALRLRHPRLWWPNGYGDPVLHDLVMTASADGSVSDRRTRRFGLRQVDYQAPLVQGPSDQGPQTENFPLRKARYLRLQCGHRATQFGVSVWKLSVYNTASPGTDLALNKTATASSVDDASRGPQNAVDGNLATRWSSAYQDDQWIAVDLGSQVRFNQIAIVWERAYPLDYVIQVSDDAATWTDVKTVTNPLVSSVQIKVNGVPVFCRGGNWGWDELLRRMLPDRMGNVMSLHQDMNFTMIRNWGGCSTREEFYSAADENGILVWSEFWEGDGLFPPAQNYDVFLAQARDTILRYRIHPCIVVWCGANEVNPPAQIDAGLNQAVQQVAPGVLYHSDSAGAGTTSGGPYGWVSPASYYSGVRGSGSFGFHTEIGLPTVPVTESMQNLAGDQPAWPIGGPWYLHDWCTRGNQQVLTYQAAIEDRLGPATSLDDFCRKAQFVNYENIRAMFEAWNAHLWNDATGLMLWMSNPAHHSTVWQTYDYDLDVNGTYYGARKGCEPVHVQASLTDWQVLVANHTARALSGATVTAELCNLSGRALAAPRSQDIAVAASSTARAFTVPFTSSLPSPHLLRLRLTSQQGTLLSDNVYWRYRSAQDLQALSRLPQVQVSATIHPGNDGQNTLGVTLRNDGDVVAAMVVLSLRDRRSRRRVLPARYSDNYLWLLPGETRDVVVSWGAGQQILPQLLVNGYNLPGQVPD
jgi:glycosyl hydrolase family 2/Ig-like domain-containing protein/F5/8 type C domain-containing protein